MNNIDDLVLIRKTTNKYEQTRKRVTQDSRYRNCSDKEIIEYLADEIEQYRDRIKNQQRIIYESIKNNIQSEGVVLDTTDDELVDEDIIEIISTTQYAEGKPIISKLEYKYKENKLLDEPKKLENIQLY